MFEVRHADDAWELGVLHTASRGEGTATELGVHAELVEFFEAGQHDHAALSEARVEGLAARWTV